MIRLWLEKFLYKERKMIEKQEYEENMKKANQLLNETRKEKFIKVLKRNI